ncbi:hypothetical protein Q4595_22450, partial [Wenyingzhuangia sp. 1_MG-2023]|nr:hypothetical protein [Wenyingzhuangia sp. 1_MG-2023]
HHPWAGVVFGSNQLDMVFLTLIFSLHGRPEIRVKVGNVHVAAKHQVILGVWAGASVVATPGNLKGRAFYPKLWRSGT